MFHVLEMDLSLKGVLKIQVQLIKFSLVIGVGKELGYFHKVELLLLLISLIIFGLVF
jgi:hypothetical protein